MPTDNPENRAKKVVADIQILKIGKGAIQSNIYNIMSSQAGTDFPGTMSGCGYILAKAQGTPRNKTKFILSTVFLSKTIHTFARLAPWREESTLSGYKEQVNKHSR